MGQCIDKTIIKTGVFCLKRASLYEALFACLLLAHGAQDAAAFSLFNKGSAICERASRDGFRKELITAGPFTLLAYARVTAPGRVLTIYIEGDGSAWRSRTCLSDDPTPRDPLVIMLASRDPSPNVIYLARPGQFMTAGASVCDERYWSNERFSETVINAMDQAIDALKKEYGAAGVSLIGYSGGGAIAVLVAARRSDVVSLRTVAGNLDPAAVNAYHKVSPLDGSLNPIDFAAQVAAIPQRHYIGSKDSVVPSFVARAYVEKEGGAASRVTVVEGATHTSGWCERWPELLALPVE